MEDGLQVARSLDIWRRSCGPIGEGRRASFGWLWAGQTVSLFGDQVTLLALPLTAVAYVGATAPQLGLLRAVQLVPFLLSPLAGVLADRLPRRTVLICADGARAGLLALIPATAALSFVQINTLYGVAAIVGICDVLFLATYQSILPIIVTREELVFANSRLQLSNSLAQVLGRPIAGVLIVLLSAPMAIALDALSFGASAIALTRLRPIQTRTVAQPAAGVGRVADIFASLREGVGFVASRPVLRAIAACTTTNNFFGQIIFINLVLLLNRDVDRPALTLGFVYGAVGAGALCGALLVNSVRTGIGTGESIIASSSILGVAQLLLPGAFLLGIGTVPALVFLQFISGFAWAIYNISQLSLRQAITPTRLLGRMTATIHLFVYGLQPFGAIAGGVLGDMLGVSTALVLGCIGAGTTGLYVLFSPLRSRDFRIEATA